jgi:two-component system, chemotaxis family, chemotaxis protein CheY
MRTVLVVDDDAGLRDIVSQGLAYEGFIVREARDGADAFAALGRGPLPDAILLDLNMPHMNGWQFRDLQKRHPEFARIPVVVMTGSKPLGIDAAGILEKPFEVEDLAAKLREVLGPERAAPRRATPPWVAAVRSAAVDRGEQDDLEVASAHRASA